MTTITSLTLRHRRLIALAWILLAALGALTANTTIGRLTYTYAMPGQPGYDASQRMIARFGIDGSIEPTIAVLRLPPGESMRGAAGQAGAARTFAAAPRAAIVAVADDATTHAPTLIADDGRTTWALIDMPNPDTGPGVGVVDRLGPVLRAAAPARASVTLTGYAQLLASGRSARPGGAGTDPSVLVVDGCRHRSSSLDQHGPLLPVPRHP